MIWIYLHIDELTYDISRYITAGSFLHISLNPFMSYSMVNDPFPRKNKQTMLRHPPSHTYIYIYTYICVFHNTSGSLNRCLVSPLQEFHVDGLARKNVELKTNDHFLNSHRIHGAGIYANIWGILMVNVIIYSMQCTYSCSSMEQVENHVLFSVFFPDMLSHVFHQKMDVVF